MQCVEEDKLDLDAPAKNYAPDIGQLQVLDGFDAAGKPRLRPPKREITTRMLMLHTAPGLRLFQRPIQSARPRARATQRDHLFKSVTHDAAPLRSGRQVGVW